MRTHEDGVRGGGERGGDKDDHVAGAFLELSHVILLTTF